MQYVFHPEALKEYSEAVKYYAERRVDIAQSFIDAVENAVYRIKESPERYPAIEADVHRYLALKFPYAILYTIETDYILILAVMHCKQKTGYWQSRLS